MEAAKEKLERLGFKEVFYNGEFCLLFRLDKGSDRFQHNLRWYADEPNGFYIDRFLTGGSKTISESDFLANHNGLADNAVRQYKDIIGHLRYEEDSNGSND